MKKFTFSKKIAITGISVAFAGMLLVCGVNTLSAAQVAYRVPCSHPVHSGGDGIFDAWGTAVVVPCGHGTQHRFDVIYY